MADYTRFGSETSVCSNSLWCKYLCPPRDSIFCKLFLHILWLLGKKKKTCINELHISLYLVFVLPCCFLHSTGSLYLHGNTAVISYLLHAPTILLFCSVAFSSGQKFSALQKMRVGYCVIALNCSFLYENREIGNC